MERKKERKKERNEGRKEEGRKEKKERRAGSCMDLLVMLLLRRRLG